MLEQVEVLQDGQCCLVTAAIDAKACVSPRQPNSWQLQGDSFVPLEMSCDPLVDVQEVSKETLDAFFDGFSSALRQNGVDDIMGPCIIRRDFYGRNNPGQDFLLVETSDEDRRANIVRFAAVDDYDANRLIQTSWKASRMANDSCDPYCAPSACVPVSACVKEANGSHTPVSTHDKNHTTGHSTTTDPSD